MRTENVKKRGNKKLLLKAPLCEIPKVGFLARLLVKEDALKEFNSQCDSFVCVVLGSMCNNNKALSQKSHLRDQIK